MKAVTIIAVVLVLNAVFQACESKPRKRKCNATDLPLSKRCRKQLKLEEDAEATAADFRQVIHRRHGRKHGKKGQKKKNKKDKLWLPVDIDTKINYEEIFKSENLYFEVEKSPTVITPPETDPAFIRVMSNIQIQELGIFNKVNVKKRNTDNFMKEEHIKTYDLIGNFGFHSPRLENKGRAILVKDPGLNTHHGCENTMANTEDIPKDGTPWVAVLERGHCDFFYKIRMAKLHNASAVVIYNHMDVADLPIMNTVGTRIPSIIIHRKDGLDLKKLIEGGKKVFLNISRTPPKFTTDSPSNSSEKSMEKLPTSSLTMRLITEKVDPITPTSSSKNIVFTNSVVILCLFIVRTLLL